MAELAQRRAAVRRVNVVQRAASSERWWRMLLRVGCAEALALFTKMDTVNLEPTLV